MQPDSLKNKFNQSMKSTRMLILILLLSTPFGLFAHEGSGHSHVHDINTKYALFTLCKTDIEGYARTISGGEYTYPSIREDITKSLISRASTGKMAFELLTHKVPENYDRQNATFFFISNIDLNLIEPYDVFVNDNPLLTFKAKPNGELEIINNMKQTHGYLRKSRQSGQTGIFTGVPAGTYTIKVTDVNGCNITTASVTIDNPPAITATGAVTSTYNGSDVSCFGSADGEITITAAGGTGTLTYVLN